MAYDQSYPDGITGVVQEAQRFFKAQLGKTFTLNTPTVEVVDGQHDTNWYINNNCPATGDRYRCVVSNMQAEELQRRFGLNNPDSRWLIVGEVSAGAAPRGPVACHGGRLVPRPSLRLILRLIHRLILLWDFEERRGRGGPFRGSSAAPERPAESRKSM